jgi:hypothetical protein
MIVIANGMGMLFIKPLWVLAFVVATLVALTALLLITYLHSRRTKIMLLISLCVSVVPVGIVLFYFNYIRHYAEDELALFIPGSILPLAMSGIAMWLSLRLRRERAAQLHKKT